MFSNLEVILIYFDADSSVCQCHLWYIWCGILDVRFSDPVHVTDTFPDGTVML